MENKEPGRPSKVRCGVIILALSYTAGMARVLYTIPWHFLAANPPGLEFAGISLTIIIPVYFALMVNIWGGSHHARIIYTVMIALGVAYSVQMHLWYTYPRLQDIFTAVLCLLQAGGIVLLFLPASNRWFKHRQLAKGLLDNRKYGF
jgi:hypothetical protein